MGIMELEGILNGWNKKIWMINVIKRVIVMVFMFLLSVFFLFLNWFCMLMFIWFFLFCRLFYFLVCLNYLYFNCYLEMVEMMMKVCVRGKLLVIVRWIFVFIFVGVMCCKWWVVLLVNFKVGLFEGRLIIFMFC